MPGKRLPMPSVEELTKLAAEHESVASLARSIGVKPTTLVNRLNQDGTAQQVKDALKVKEREAVTPPAEVKPVDHPDRIALQRAKDEIKVLRKDNREYAEKLASQQEFFEQVVDATRVSVSTPKLKTKRRGKGKPTNSIITPCYDQQFGQFVRPSDTPGGKGNFNEKVFDERLARWVNGICETSAARAENYQIEEFIIPMGGDQVEGDEIFGGQAWQLEMGPPRQVWELTLKMEAAVKEIVRFAKEEIGVPYIALYGIPGNHGKVGGKRGGARPSDYSWDWLHHMMLFDRLRGEPIDQFAIEPAGSLFFYCAGHEFQAIHGDEIRGSLGIPFYGMQRFDSRSVRLHNRVHRYMIMGHIHQRAEIPNGAGETLVSGDWVGANNLSKVIQASSRPQQAIHFVSAKWGLDGGERIYFQEADEAYVPTAIHGNA